MSGRLRITGGLLGRRLIDVPKAADRGAVRPTSDRVREALFSALASRFTLHETQLLDLFAGSGALGLEGLSRGGAHCTFVERDRGTAQTLRENVTSLDLSARTRIIEKDAWRALPSLAPASIDVVFADPPYALALDAAFIDACAAVLKPGGWFVLERAKKSEAIEPGASLSLEFERAWGQSRVSMFERLAPAEDVTA